MSIVIAVPEWFLWVLLVLMVLGIVRMWIDIYYQAKRTYILWRQRRDLTESVVRRVVAQSGPLASPGNSATPPVPPNTDLPRDQRPGRGRR